MSESNKHKIQKEFLDNVKIINLLNANIKNELDHQSFKSYLFSVKVNNGDDIATVECIFKILEKDKIWYKKFYYQEFEKYKSKMGFDGTWKAFFKTFEQAVNKTDGGNIIIKTKKDNKNYTVLQLTFYHPLSEDLKVKSEIEMTVSYSCSSEEFRNYNFDLMQELLESKKAFVDREREKFYEGVSANSGLLTKSTGMVPTTNFLFAGNKNDKKIKRKFNSDLINPNVKRVKAKGATFTADDEDEEDEN